MFDPQFYFNTHYLMLKSTHGRVIIKKDTIFYHATDEDLSYIPDP